LWLLVRSSPRRAAAVCASAAGVLLASAGTGLILGAGAGLVMLGGLLVAAGLLLGWNA